MQRGDVKKRIDAFYHQPGFRVLDRELNERCGAMRTLRSLATGLTNGDHGGLNYVQNGVRYLRGQSVTEHGLDLVDELYISDDEHERMLRSEVIPGDVLFTIAGSIGNACVVSGVERANINQAIVRVRPSSEVLPQYLADFLNSKYGKFQSNRLANGGVQLNINFSEVGQIGVPVLPMARQGELVAAMDAARAERRDKLALADELLAGLDDYLLSALGLTQPIKGKSSVFAVTRGAALSRFDPHYHLPAFAQNQQMLAGIGAKPLGSIVKFSDEVWKPEKDDAPTFRYIEISCVDRDTGEVHPVEMPVSEAPSRARMVVRVGDIVASLTRPHHGSIAQITPELDGCIASTGFAVIRGVDESMVLNDYLWCILRRKMCLSQMLQRASGGNYPAITEPELAKVLIPVPAMNIQKVVAAEARRRREEAHRLRTAADYGWLTAKQWFGDQMLGAVQP